MDIRLIVIFLITLRPIFCELMGVDIINYVTPKYKYNAAVNFCNRLGVKLFEPKCKASNDKLNELANKYIKVSPFRKEYIEKLDLMNIFL